MNKLEKCKENKKCKKRLIFILVLFSVFLVDFLVYFSGGTFSSLPHIMYIPIILASFSLGIRSGLVVAVVAGLTVGPFMPEDVKLGIMQHTQTWTLRMGFYLTVSVTVSYLVERIEKLNKVVQDKAYESPFVGLPGLNKFILDLEESIKENASRSFTVLAFKYDNMKQVSRHVDLYVGRRSIKYLLDASTEYFTDKLIYSCNLDEFIVVLPETDIQTSCEEVEKFMKIFDEVHYVNNFPIYYQLKCGVINFPFHGSNSNTIMQNIARTIEQVEDSNKKIAIYNGYLGEKNLENYHNLVRFIEDFKGGKLTLYYQPKIDIRSNHVIGVEALLRWKDPDKNYTPIGKMIKIIENAGLIGQVTKWVVEKSIIQMSEWQRMGLNINISVNLSSKDLSNGALLEYTKKYIEKYKINPHYYEFELTERSIIENQGKSSTYLEELKKLGICISIDDYGTGYNSLLNMVSLPVDYIKIDKYFIKNMNDPQGEKLVEDMISLIHNLGKKVLAEGVETKEQLFLLQKMDCDYVQGYYYSKPVPADKVINLISNINNDFEDGYRKTLDLAE
ncbi:MAG: EAL domain-containing protein [Clostridiaceae bacterium]